MVSWANYEEVSTRVLREVDRFWKKNAVAMYARMVDFKRAQKEHAENMNKAWGALLLQVENVDAAKYNGSFSVWMGATLKDDDIKSINVALEWGKDVELVTAKVEDMSMPLYPPQPEPSTNGVHNASSAIESSMLNVAVLYRDPLPEE